MKASLVVIGTGLIGGSLAKAACCRGDFETVWAINRGDLANTKALQLGVANKAALYEQIPDVISALVRGDIILIAVPVGAYETVFELVSPVLPEGVVVTDVGSTKTAVNDAASRVWGSVPSYFVPGHPIAGSEQSGVEASDAALFEGRRCILTPNKDTDPEALSTVRALWESVGSTVDEMDAAHHDDILGATSHLPHVLAYAIVDALYTLDQKTEVFRYAAGGFRDFTRIAESDPVMWRDIFLNNRDSILRQLDNFEQHLSDLRAHIEHSDADAIETVLERSQGARKLFSNIKTKPHGIG